MTNTNAKNGGSKFKLLKIFINIVLLTLFSIILYQNVHPVAVELLLWDTEVSLTFLLLGMALLGAAITFVTVLLIGRKAT